MSHGSIYYTCTIEIFHLPKAINKIFHLPKAINKMWTKQNIFHENGHKIKYWCWCKCQQNMPTEQCQYEKEIFHWKKNIMA